VRRRRKHSSTNGEGPLSTWDTSQSPTSLDTQSVDRIRPPIPSPQATRGETLTSFYERGIAARNWEVFHQNEPIRIVYVGDSSSNLHNLVQAEDTANRLHFPFPAIKPLLPWQPSLQQSQPAGYLTAPICQDLVSFPAKDVRDSLVQTYIDDIHPTFPILDDVDEFRRQYRDAANPPPLLLFHAVLLAAARVSRHPMVSSARPTVTATLYRRAKALFDMRHENDRALLVQTALLMAWHVEDLDTISSGAYHWIGVAARIALGLGMHRDLTGKSR
jgi:transcriptional regulatory protein AMDR